ncbi:MAG: alpha/beta hydrolase [Dehalococcoidia bacterium]|nr:alpha/beta hydrolase [Dehalococcoidia bacterium]
MPHATVNGARLWYEDADATSGREPILFHHGWTGSRVNWAPVAERLRDRYRVILMECRGAGESEHTEDGYTLEQYAADVAGMADHLGLERFTYAGHSMGGGIGYRLALDHARRLERLVLMAPIPADGISGPMAQVTRPTEADHDAEVERGRRMRFRPDMEPDAWLEDRFRHRRSVSDGHFVQSWAAMRALSVGDRLPDVQTPTLMIAGRADGLLGANLKDFQRLPNATLQVFSHAGHEVAIHEPDGVARCIDQFMQMGVVSARTLAERLQD